MSTLPKDAHVSGLPDAFRQNVVIVVPNAADRGIDLGFGQSLGVFDRQLQAVRSQLWISLSTSDVAC